MGEKEEEKGKEGEISPDLIALHIGWGRGELTVISKLVNVWIGWGDQRKAVEQGEGEVR